MPFGIHRVPAKWVGTVTDRNGSGVTIAFRHSPRSCLLPPGVQAKLYERVTIAFRHSPRSCLPPGRARVKGTSSVTIAFRHSPRSCRNGRRKRPDVGKDCHHCLSAFTAFLPGPEVLTESSPTASPLPFGIHRVPARVSQMTGLVKLAMSPLPFGIHRVPAGSDGLHCNE